MNRAAVSLLEQYQASMVLHSVGDALGFKNGKWELCTSVQEIHDDLRNLGGLDSIRIEQSLSNLSDTLILSFIF
jgi:hypothetical protein